MWLGTHEHGAYRFDGTAFRRFRPDGAVGGAIATYGRDERP